MGTIRQAEQTGPKCSIQEGRKHRPSPKKQPHQQRTMLTKGSTGLLCFGMYHPRGLSCGAVICFLHLKLRRGLLGSTSWRCLLPKLAQFLILRAGGSEGQQKATYIDTRLRKTLIFLQVASQILRYLPRQPLVGQPLAPSSVPPRVSSRVRASGGPFPPHIRYSRVLFCSETCPPLSAGTFSVTAPKKFPSGPSVCRAPFRGQVGERVGERVITRKQYDSGTKRRTRNNGAGHV